jgi:hypothetical protein
VSGLVSRLALRLRGRQADQFTRDRGGHLGLRLARGRQATVALAQANLRFPPDRLDPRRLLSPEDGDRDGQVDIGTPTAAEPLVRAARCPTRRVGSITHIADWGSPPQQLPAIQDARI